MTTFIDSKISLTTAEKELFQVLLQAVDAHESKQPPVQRSERTIMRVAGGWVRDKLLKKTSHDIDIALNNMSGVQFANCVNDYLTSQGMETRTIAVIQANPDQSKHLETANLRVLGFDIDCVNLRAETYTDSRIPEIRIGTALEDAQRRDFTINALFYNINDDCVEDYCGTGLQDLQQGLIKTPISPFITFKDDPLRVLRAIRFCSRFNFVLDTELLQAASNREIQEALYAKVSRERVYKECEGMIYNTNPLVPSSSSTSDDEVQVVHEEAHTIGCRPALAFAIMYRMSILDAVFFIDHLHRSMPFITPAPTSNAASLANVLGLETAASAYFPPLSLLQSLPCAESSVVDGVTSGPTFASFWSRIAIETIFYANLLTSPNKDYSNPRLFDFVFCQESQWSLRRGPHIKTLFYSAALMMLQPLMISEKKKDVSFLFVVLRDGLKMENVTIKNIQTMIDAAKAFIGLAFSNRGVTVDTAATILRNAKELWRESLILATAYTLAVQQFNKFEYSTREELAEAMKSVPSIVPATGGWFEPIPRTTSMMFIITLFQRMEDDINFMNIDGCWNIKPLMDGAQLMNALQLPKGPLVGKVMEAQIQWQIRQRSSDKDACVAYLKQIFPSS